MLLYWPTMSETDGGGMALETELSHQYSCSPEGQHHPGLYQKRSGHQGEGGGCSPLTL